MIYYVYIFNVPTNHNKLINDFLEISSYRFNA